MFHWWLCPTQKNVVALSIHTEHSIQFTVAEHTIDYELTVPLRCSLPMMLYFIVFNHQTIIYWSIWVPSQLRIRNTPYLLQFCHLSRDFKGCSAIKNSTVECSSSSLEPIAYSFVKQKKIEMTVSHCATANSAIFLN